MSDTDIYKNREAMPMGSGKRPDKCRRRRRTSTHTFDDKERKRRSKNSGLRRILHLSRKKENEKFFWWGLLVSIVVVLLMIAVWQFVILEIIVRKQSTETDYIDYQRSIPATPVPESAPE